MFRFLSTWNAWTQLAYPFEQKKAKTVKEQTWRLNTATFMESKDQIDAAKEGEAYSLSAAATLEFDDATLKGESWDTHQNTQLTL